MCSCRFRAGGGATGRRTFAWQRRMRICSRARFGPHGKFVWTRTPEHEPRNGCRAQRSCEPSTQPGTRRGRRRGWCRIEGSRGSSMIRKVAVLAIALAVSGLAQGTETYKARLTAVPADARTRPTLAGIGSATATLSGTKLTTTGMFEGLLSPASMAQLHSAVAAGVRGPAIGDLTIPKATSGSISGSFDLTPQQVESLHKGGLYIEIHSEKAPDGVIWGWLIK